MVRNRVGKASCILSSLCLLSFAHAGITTNFDGNILSYNKNENILPHILSYDEEPALKRRRRLQPIAMPIFPIRYDMFNGGNNTDVLFWDDEYLPSAEQSYEWLGGSIGELSDGHKELQQSWDNKFNPYVGWQWSTGNQASITFFFGELTTVDEVRISVDDPADQLMSVCRPSVAIIGGAEYDFPENDAGNGMGPYEAVIPLQKAIMESQIQVNLIAECDWVLVSEIEFYANDSDLDGVPDNIDKCPYDTVADNPTDEVGIDRFIFDGSSSPLIGQGGTYVSIYSIDNTMGCSCEQILDQMGPCVEGDCKEKGCSMSKLNEWVAMTDISEIRETDHPSAAPSDNPTDSPSSRPSVSPSSVPSHVPSSVPTVKPSSHPSQNPTTSPTSRPKQVSAVKSKSKSKGKSKQKAPKPVKPKKPKKTKKKDKKTKKKGKRKS